MCQAIVKPADEKIQKEVLQRAWTQNPNGAGIAYVDEEKGAVRIEKGYMKFKNLWRAYKKHESKTLLIHFRYATHGAVNRENCHPFSVGDGAMMHNGILNNFEPWKGSGKSDTRHFIDSFLSPVLKDSRNTIDSFFANPLAMPALENLIGSSKLAFISPSGAVYIVNEALGETVEGVWYSAGFPSATVYGFCSAGTVSKGKPVYYTSLESVSDETDAEVMRQLWIDEEGETADSKEFLDWKKRKEIDAGRFRCTLCDCAANQLYSLSGEMLCNSCWKTFAN
jgi:hypothetical protein